jgi:hypothetical protein
MLYMCIKPSLSMLYMCIKPLSMYYTCVLNPSLCIIHSVFDLLYCRFNGCGVVREWRQVTTPPLCICATAPLAYVTYVTYVTVYLTHLSLSVYVSLWLIFHLCCAPHISGTSLWSQVFTRHVIAQSYLPYNVFAVDLDKDGDMDVLSADYYAIMFYENHAAPTSQVT